MECAMEYEDALRYVHDRCDRSGDPNELADADVWRGACEKQDFTDVARGIASAIERLIKDAENISWTDEESRDGGLRPNFELIFDAKENLEEESNIEASYCALANIVHALKALILKQSGNIPEEYKSG